MNGRRRQESCRNNTSGPKITQKEMVIFSMKKIIMILTNGFGSDPRVYKEAKTLVQAGHDVEILCWDRENKYINKEDEIIDGIKIKRFFARSKYGYRI